MAFIHGDSLPSSRFMRYATIRNNLGSVKVADPELLKEMSEEDVSRLMRPVARARLHTFCVEGVVFGHYKEIDKIFLTDIAVISRMVSELSSYMFQDAAVRKFTVERIAGKLHLQHGKSQRFWDIAVKDFNEGKLGISLNHLKEVQRIFECQADVHSFCNALMDHHDRLQNVEFLELSLAANAQLHWVVSKMINNIIILYRNVNVGTGVDSALIRANNDVKKFYKFASNAEIYDEEEIVKMTQLVDWYKELVTVFGRVSKCQKNA